MTKPKTATESPSKVQQRMRIVVRGAVQGVGFRPFIYRLAREEALTGRINNSSLGVFIEVEGRKEQLDRFLLRIEREKPPRSFIQSMETALLDVKGFADFSIAPSDTTGEKVALVLPDIATCPDCLAEIFGPSDRRYLYPFTNCTNCGPRFTIIEALPYDRANTSMKSFTMCDECQAEYDDPMDRRFHAQPNACPKCGPQLELWSAEGGIQSEKQEALSQAAEAIRAGYIVAIKGVGGFHLVADARSSHAVTRLRERKHREEKPFALMFPSISQVRAACEVSDLEERLLLSPESPIVLLHTLTEAAPISFKLSAEIAPGNPYLGALLPYSPLHHILLRALEFPVVATSGNLSDEPICIDEREALGRLGGIADFLLVHNRPIVRHVDDSIARVMMDREMVLRRARGYAPLPLSPGRPLPTVLAVGAHLKNTVAISNRDNVFVSQHIGDLENAEALSAFERVISDLGKLYEISPSAVACDAHPAYLSSRFAGNMSANPITVQHHYAHVLSCMTDNALEGPVLGIAWDGTGYGLDGTVWGGEFLRVPSESKQCGCACQDFEPDEPFQRVASLRTFRLPGGEAAIKEPRRAALGLLFELMGDDLAGMPVIKQMGFRTSEVAAVRTMLGKGANSPVTSSAGRLFDAVASLVGLRQVGRFEGQAAMMLEFAARAFATEHSYDFEVIVSPRSRSGPRGFAEAQLLVDWGPMIHQLLREVTGGAEPGLISAKFHNTLVEIMVAVARRVGEERIVLTGGCFLNQYLTERAVQRLGQSGFRVYWHQRVPPGDGGIALGQIAAAARAIGN
jgi:hydrogenase maturation protein HypF